MSNKRKARPSGKRGGAKNRGSTISRLPVDSGKRQPETGGPGPLLFVIEHDENYNVERVAKVLDLSVSPPTVFWGSES